MKKVDSITMAFRMKEHSQNSKSENGMVSPLFLYVSFNAAHTPLQSEIEWLEKTLVENLQKINVLIFLYFFVFFSLCCFSF